MEASGKWFDDVAVGDRFGSSVTITDAHIFLGAGLIRDFNPHHVDDQYARQSRFGTRILHGVITSAIMGGPVGMYFHGTAMALQADAEPSMSRVSDEMAPDARREPRRIAFAYSQGEQRRRRGHIVETRMGRGFAGDLLCRTARQWVLPLASRRFVHLIRQSLLRDHVGFCISLLSTLRASSPRCGRAIHLRCRGR